MTSIFAYFLRFNTSLIKQGLFFWCIQILVYFPFLSFFCFFRTYNATIFHFLLFYGVRFYELFFDFMKNPQYLVLFCYLHIIFIYICGTISLIFFFWSQNLRTFPSFYAFSGLFLKMASVFTYLFLYFSCSNGSKVLRIS